MFTSSGQFIEIAGAAASADRDVPGQYEVRRRDAGGPDPAPGGRAAAAPAAAAASSPAAAPAAAAVLRPPAQEEVLQGVTFETNSAKLRPESASILDGVVTRIERCHCSHVDIRGYTDSVGKPEYNQKLSERRANAVKDYLEAHGVARRHPERARVRRRESARQQRDQGGTRRESPGNRAVYGARRAVTGQARAARAARAPCGRIRKGGLIRPFFSNAHGLKHDGTETPPPRDTKGCAH